MPQPFPSARFPSTAWSCVRQAQDPRHPDFTAALNRLMLTYWRPVFHYLRAKGHPAHDAEDLTQAFFLRFLAKGWLDRADQGRGRFRDFLRTLVGRFALHQTGRPNGQAKFEGRFASISALMTDADRAYEPAGRETPEQAFDRQWKADVLAAVRRSLRAFYEGLETPAERQRYEIFAACHFVDRTEEQPTQDDLAARFGVSRDQVRYALAEVGRRYERFLRQEVRDQVGGEDDIDGEIAGLG